MSWKAGLAALGVVLIAGGAAGAYYWYFRETAPIVTVEALKTRDLEAVVSASGKIQPKRLVNISADTPGRVVDLAVNEGDRVAKGQFLLQIDPKLLRTRVQGGAAGLLAAEGALAQMQQSVETARVQLEQTQQTLARQRDLWQQQLTTRESLQRAENDLRGAESALQEREKQTASQAARVGQERAQLDSARYDLSKVRIESPIDGIVTRRNIQEGETAVIGTMNNPGTVLLTLADMSVIQAEVEVDETNIPSLVIGQTAKITIDALPDRTFRGHVTEIGNSPIQPTGTGAQASQTTQATNFKVAVILDEPIPDVRPGFTCSADITTAKRAGSVGVPIPAVAVRELVYDANGQIVRTPRKEAKRARWEWFWMRGRSVEPVASAAELEPGQTRKETEGVYTIRNGMVQFVPIKIGISGDKYFEVLAGLKAGDIVVTGPYNVVRNLTDGDEVEVESSRR
jgi:HlyD family secretion protein